MMTKPNIVCTRLVRVGAFPGNLSGLELVPSKWGYPVQPAGNSNRWAALQDCAFSMCE
jgi:hypothetical protein